MLNALSMNILGLLQRNRLSAGEVLDRLTNGASDTEASLDRDQLIEYLLRFEAMGLIVSSQACD